MPLPEFQSISFEQGTTIVMAGLPEHLHGGGCGFLDCMDHVLYHEGSISVDGDWRVEKKFTGNAIIIDGNLDVDGNYMDISDSPFLSLIVLGDMRADNVSMGSFLTVTKNLTVRHLLFGASGHDCSYEVGGDLTCDVLFLYDHVGNPDPESSPERLIAGKKYHYGANYNVPNYDVQGGSMESVLTKEAFTALKDNRYGDPESFREMIFTNQAIFR